MPADERVGPLAFSSLSLLMPVTYALLTPLALFSLDSGSWETRSHHTPTEAEPALEPVREPIREFASAPARGELATIGSGVVHEPAMARTRSRSRAELPAA